MPSPPPSESSLGNSTKPIGGASDATATFFPSHRPDARRRRIQDQVNEDLTRFGYFSGVRKFLSAPVSRPLRKSRELVQGALLPLLDWKSDVLQIFRDKLDLKIPTSLGAAGPIH
jgi:hypothetical protein